MQGRRQRWSTRSTFVYRQWNLKPCGFVSFGGASGGLRVVQAAKLQVTTPQMMLMARGKMVPMAAKQIESDGVFTSNALIDQSADAMLDELLYLAHGLKAMRASKPG